MKRLQEYIYEELDKLIYESSDEANEPASEESQEKLKKAAKQIIELLQKKEKLSDYVGSLNKILDGTAVADKDNTKLYLTALIKLFSGDGNADSDAYNKYTCKGEEDINVSELYPTQSEIDIKNSAKWATKDWGAKGVKDMFSDKGFGSSFPVPVLVYNDGSKNWIIDGHHRWSQVALINPKAKLHCMTIVGKQSALEFLKLTQSIIAGVTAARGKGEKLPVGEANPNNNIFGPALKGDKIKERIKEMLDKADPKVLKILNTVLQECKVINKKGNLVQGEVSEKLFDVSNPKVFKESVGTLVMRNRDKMIENHQAPEKWTAPRPVMPQSDKAGKTGSEDSGIDKEGSALNKLKNVKALPDV